MITSAGDECVGASCVGYVEREAHVRLTIAGDTLPLGQRELDVAPTDES